MQKQEAGVSGCLVKAASESEEAGQEEFPPDPAGCSPQNWRQSDSGTAPGTPSPLGAGKSHLTAGAAHL